MKSSLKNMVLVLFCITLVSSACVGLVNMITVEPIAKAKAAAVQAALAEVLPEFDATEKSEHEADELLIVAHKATKGGEVVGYAIESATKNGFSGLVRLMVGFDTKGTILNVNGDVDALTAATISSRAYAEAVARAYSVFKVVAGWEKEVQATTGASQTKKEE